MEKIGQGSFSKVYKKGNKVFIKSNDAQKECMALGWFPSSRLFPKIKFSDNGFDYEMKYYKKHKSLKTALKPTEWEKYQELRRIFIQNKFSAPRIQSIDHWINAFKKIKNKTLRKHMCNALEAMGNYGPDVCFEISPRNVAISNTGNLILLDCFFMKHQLEETRK